MTQKLRLGDTLALPLDWITLATVVYGARGSGKTSLGAVMAEEATKARQRFCAIDLKGDWYGLKSTADGKGEGIPVVVFGGDHQDVPLEDGAGKFVGETVAQLGQSCILDLEHFSKGKRVRFLADFFEALYHANRDPLLLLLDEAQAYAPQVVRNQIGPDAARCLGAMEDIVKLGRKHGIGPVLFTQRGSGLNKEVSELCDLLVAFRTPGPLDQDRIRDWLNANTTKEQRDEVERHIASMPTGTAVFASAHPDLKIFGVHAVRRRETFDSSATPKVGKRRAEPKKLARPHLEELRAKMSEAIERQKADDPRELRRRIGELEKALAAARADVEVEERTIEVPALDREALESLGRDVLDKVSDLETELQRVQEDVKTLFVTAADEHEFCFSDGTTPAERAAVKPRTFFLNERHELPRGAMRKAAGDGGNPAVGTGALRRMLTALAQRPEGLTRRALGLRAGVSSRSGTFANNLSRARAAGWIEGRGDHIRITAGGIAALGHYDPLPTGRALLEYWLRELGSAAPARILRALADAYPDAHARGTRRRRGTFAQVRHLRERAQPASWTRVDPRQRGTEGRGRARGMSLRVPLGSMANDQKPPWQCGRCLGLRVPKHHRLCPRRDEPDAEEPPEGWLTQEDVDRAIAEARRLERERN